MFAIICDISHNFEYEAAVMASLGFYFKKKMHSELPCQWRQNTLLFDKVEMLSQVNWHDVGVHAVLSYTDMQDLV